MEDTQTTEAEIPMETTPDAGAAPKTEEKDVKKSYEGILGVDFGSESAILALIDLKTVKPDILRNDLSSQKTPTIISFHDGTRSFGDAAKQMTTSHRNSTFNQLIKMIGQETKDIFLEEAPFFPAKDSISNSEKSLNFSFTSGKESFTLLPEQMIAMFFSKLYSFIPTEENVAVSIVVPETFNEDNVKSIALAAEIASIDLQQVIYRSTACAISNATRKSETSLDGQHVMYIDIGDSYATCAVYLHSKKSVTHVASRCDSKLGSRFVDQLIYDALLEETKERYSSAALSAKGELRLFGAAQKLKETLSGVSEAQATCENLLDGEDVGFKFTREQLEQICESLKVKLIKLVEDCVKEVLEKDGRVSQVELVGGGMRSPFVKEAILKGLEANGEPLPLQYTLDAMAANCVGAAYSLIKRFEPQGAVSRPIFDTIGTSEDGHGIFEINSDSFTFNEEDLEKFKEVHLKFAENDEKIRKTHEAKNKLESYIFDMKSTANGSRKFSELIKKEECLQLLNEADEWLYNIEEESFEVFDDKLNELKNNLKPSCDDYFKKTEEEERRKEIELEELSKQAAEELEKSGGKDDHDFRKLSKPDRMKKVTMNKEEGTSLFKDGNYEPASLRYKRALQHCDKFFDLSKEDEREVKTLKSALHLNLSMCHIKLSNHDLALDSLNVVLEDDEHNVKALYRRAVVHEAKKDLDKAKKDLLKAQTVNEEDKAVQRLLQRIEIQKKREKEKQKKMAQKMFG